MKLKDAFEEKYKKNVKFNWIMNTFLRVMISVCSKLFKKQKLECKCAKKLLNKLQTTVIKYFSNIDGLRHVC